MTDQHSKVDEGIKSDVGGRGCQQNRVILHVMYTLFWSKLVAEELASAAVYHGTVKREAKCLHIDRI
jgi:hypothetical protein